MPKKTASSTRLTDEELLDRIERLEGHASEMFRYLADSVAAHFDSCSAATPADREMLASVRRAIEESPGRQSAEG